MLENGTAMAVVEEVVSRTGAFLLERWPGTTQLTDTALRQLYPNRRFALGWRIPASELGLPEPLIVALVREDGFNVPSIALERRHALCEMPHVEKDGVFCLLPSSTPIRLPVTGELAIHLVGEAVKVYSDAHAGVNRRDFLDEFGTYWTLDCSAQRDVYAWFGDFEQTRTVYVSNTSAGVMVADSVESLESWMKKLGRPVRRRDVRTATFVHLDEPLFPEDYPSDSAELLRLLFRRCPDAVELVLASVRLDEDAVVVWCFEHDGKPVMGATLTQIHQRFPHLENRGQAFLSGRNRVRVPANVLSNRLSQAKFPALRASVVRVDSDFLVGRTAGVVDDGVRRLKVVVVGCGALGATIAMLLAQAGVRDLTLIDGDYLTYQNVGRHILGARYIGRNKAEALRDEICARYVDYDVVALPSKWQGARESNSRLFERADLVISATGDWISEAELNALLEAAEIPPTIFTWLERYGVAGHATFVSADASLRWVLNEYGEAECQVAKVPGELPREAACGAYYQPFSAAASAEVAAMAVSLAISAATGEITTGQTWTWVGPYGHLLKVGGEIMPFWRPLVFGATGFQKVYRHQLTPPSARLPASNE